MSIIRSLFDLLLQKTGRMYNTGTGNIGYRFQCRSNQKQRRKLERRTGNHK